MDSSIITALLTASIPAIALIIVQIIISLKQQRVQDIRFEMTINEIKEHIGRIEKKQEDLNTLLERIVRLEMKSEASWRYIDELKEINHIK